MLRLRSHLLPAGRAAWPLSAASSLLRHLLLYSSAAATKSAAPFVAEDYLVTACGLTPAQALRSSKYVAHLKSPSNPDAVLAFLADIGLTKADIAAAIARDARFLCSKVGVTLTPRISQLREIGLSPPQISRLIAVNPQVFQRPKRVSHLAFYLSYFGSFDKVHAALKKNPYLLDKDVERVVRPNIAFLGQCGLSDCDITQHYAIILRILVLELERLKEIVMWVDKFGVPRSSAMFKHALAAICSIRQGRVSEKLDFLNKALGCSQAEMCIAVRKMPWILAGSEAKLSQTVEFLKMEIGLKSEYIVRRPALLAYSMNRRLMPRHYVLKVLKQKGLLKKDHDFYTVVSEIEKKFAKKFLDPYKENVPGLADAYAAACAGEVPPCMLLAWRKQCFSQSSILAMAEDKLSCTVEFLKMEVGLCSMYIVHRPALLAYSMKKRLMPRHYVLKFLKEKGLVDKDVDLYSVVCQIEKTFIKRFLDPHKESVPGLADAYAAACAGQVPTLIQP